MRWRPGLHPVPIKSTAQQDLQSLHRVRQQQVHHSTGIANQLRGIAHEYGVCFPVGLRRLCREVPFAFEDADNGLTSAARELLARRFIDLLAIREEIERTSQRIVVLAEALPAWPRLRELHGFGVMVPSSFLASIGDGRQFKRSRQVAAWLGLVPPPRSAGVVTGARRLAQWINPLIERRGFNKAVVALANKNARIALAHRGQRCALRPRKGIRFGRSRPPRSLQSR